MLERIDCASGKTLINGLTDFACGKGKVVLPDEKTVLRYKEVFDDTELVNTCLCLFKNNLNVSRAAAELYMHRNTLIYRIAKLKKLTGLTVTDFSDAVVFSVLYRVYLNAKKSEARREKS